GASQVHHGDRVVVAADHADVEQTVVDHGMRQDLELAAAEPAAADVGQHDESTVDDDAVDQDAAGVGLEDSGKVEQGVLPAGTAGDVGQCAGVVDGLRRKTRGGAGEHELAGFGQPGQIQAAGARLGF